MANYFEKIKQESEGTEDPVEKLDLMAEEQNDKIHNSNELPETTLSSDNLVAEKKPSAFISFLMWFFLTTEVTMFILGCIDWWNGSHWDTFGWIGLGCAMVVFVIAAFRIFKEKKKTASLVGIIVAIPIFILTLCGITSESHCYPSYKAYYSPYVAQPNDFVYIGRLGATINTQEEHDDNIVIKVNNEYISHGEDNQRGIFWDLDNGKILIHNCLPNTSYEVVVTRHDDCYGFIAHKYYERTFTVSFTTLR